MECSIYATTCALCIRAGMTAKGAKNAEVRSNSLFMARILALITALNHHQGFCEREVYQPNVQTTVHKAYRLATTPY